MTDGDGAPEDPTGLWTATSPTSCPPGPRTSSTRRRRSRCWSPTPTPTAPWSPAIGERSLDTWDVVPDADPVGIDDLHELVVSAGVLEAEVRDPGSELSQQINSEGPTTVTVFGGLPPMVDAARGRLLGHHPRRLRGPRGRRWGCPGWSSRWPRSPCWSDAEASARCWWTQGRSSVELAALTLVEVAGAGGPRAGGRALRQPTVRRAHRRRRRAPRSASAGHRAGRAASSLATIVVASFVDAFQRHRRASGRALVAGRPDPVADRGGHPRRGRGGERVRRRLGLRHRHRAVPAGGGGSGGACWCRSAAAALLARLARSLAPSTARARLTLSRLARDPSSSTAFLAATVAFGAVGYGLLFQVSADDAASDKVSARVGAHSVFELTLAGRRRPAGRGGRPVDPRAAAGADRRRHHPRPAARSRPGHLRPSRPLVATVRPRPRPGRRHRPARRGRRRRAGPAGGRRVRRTHHRDPRQTGRRSRCRTAWSTGSTRSPGSGPTTPCSSSTSRCCSRWLRRRRSRSSRPSSGAGTTPTRSTAAADAVGADPVLKGTAAELRAEPLAGGAELGHRLPPGVHGAGAAARACSCWSGCTAATASSAGSRTRPSRTSAIHAASPRARPVSSSPSCRCSAPPPAALAAYAVTLSLADRLDPLPDLRPALAVTGTQQLLLAAVAFVVAALALTLLHRAPRPGPVRQRAAAR